MLLHLVALGEDVAVGRVADRPEEGRDVELPAAAAAVQIDVDVVVDVELNIHPGAAVRNDPVGVERPPGGVTGLLKADARRPVQLADDHPLSPVDDEGALLGHDRNVAHVDPLRHLGAVDLQQEIDVERRIVNLAVLDAVDHVALLLAGRADLVGDELERHLLVEALDRENLVEHLLKPLILPLRRRHVALEEITVGVNLEADQIRNFENVPELPKINSFRHTLLVWLYIELCKNFCKKNRRFTAQSAVFCGKLDGQETKEPTCR